MNRTNAKYDPNDIMKGLPKPWRSMPGVKISISVGTITASIPLSSDQVHKMGLVGSSGIYDQNNIYHEHTAEEIAKDNRLVIGAVDKFTGEWTIYADTNGEPVGTPFISFSVQRA